MNKNRDYEFLYFTKKERRGILLIVIINLLILLSPNITRQLFIDSITINDSFYKELRLPMYQKNDTPYHDIERVTTVNQNNQTNTKFLFDPNAINVKQWQMLGVSEKTSTTIAKYLSKGGRFKKANDLYKIWGLPSSTASELIPYVRIKADLNNQKDPTSHFQLSENKKPLSIININDADSATFEKLYGIGPKLSQRIILFRKKLGGFYDIRQISEVWGLQDSIFQKIKEQLTISDVHLVKININKATLEQLQSHPYIGYKQGKTLLNYRNQHGSFEKLEDIQKIITIDKETYSKMEHYLTVE